MGRAPSILAAMSTWIVATQQKLLKQEPWANWNFYQIIRIIESLEYFLEVIIYDMLKNHF